MYDTVPKLGRSAPSDWSLAQFAGGAMVVRVQESPLSQGTPMEYTILLVAVTYPRQPEGALFPNLVSLVIVKLGKKKIF